MMNIKLKLNIIDLTIIIRQPNFIPLNKVDYMDQTMS